MEQPEPEGHRYRSCLLRMWWDARRHDWHISLQSTRSGEVIHLPDLEALRTVLRFERLGSLTEGTASSIRPMPLAAPSLDATGTAVPPATREPMRTIRPRPRTRQALRQRSNRVETRPRRLPRDAASGLAASSWASVATGSIASHRARGTAPGRANDDTSSDRWRPGISRPVYEMAPRSSPASRPFGVSRP